MSRARSDELIEQYIERLTQAAASLPAAERDDLIGDIREHIAVALQEEEHVDETTIRNLLDRLGAPEDVVEAASVGTQRPAPAAARSGGIDAAALLALALSPLVPPYGWVVGAMLVVASRTWSRYEKRATLAGIPAGALATAAALWFLPGSLLDAMAVRVMFPIFALPYFAVLLAGPAGAGYLALRRRAAVADDAASTPGGPLEWAAVVVLLLSWFIPVLGWVAGAAMVGVSRRWSRREKVIGLLAVPLATVLAGAVLYVLHLPGVGLPIDSPIPVPRRPGTVPILGMGPVGAAYLAWLLVVRRRAHRSPSTRDRQGATP